MGLNGWSKGRLLLVLSLLMVSLPSLMAQTSGTGALSGIVTDPSGAAIPDATVTITSTETGQSRTVMTGADGQYNFGLLQPGNYSVKFGANGFGTTQVPSVTIVVTETAVLNRSLQVGAQTTSVTVEANVEAVQTESSSIGTAVSSKGVTDIPLSTRNYTDLLAMSAGANAGVENSTALGTAGTTPAVNGAATSQNTYQMDGSSINNFFSFNNTSGSGNLGGFYAGIVIPNPDAIEEFKIQTSNYDAGYGRNVGANVNVVTKSGTNSFHGTAFEFFRNTVLNANDFFRNFTGGTRLPFNQNQFGGVLGGPIKKDKLFFFASYQQTGQKNGIAGAGFSSTTLAPIPGGNSGNGRGTCPVNFTLAAQCDATGQAFIANLGNNVCPTNPVNAGNPNILKFDKTTVGGLQVLCDGSDISPVAIKILQLKLANGNYYVPGSGSSNFYLPQTFSIPALYQSYQGIGNLDYVINIKNSLSLRYIQSPDQIQGFIGASATNVPGTPLTSIDKYNDANVKLTTLISNNLVNEAHLSWLRVYKKTSEPFVFTDSQIGLTPIDPRTDAFPTMPIVGLFQMGEHWFGDQSAPDNQFLIADQISWTHGRHTIRVGVEIGLTRAGIAGPQQMIGDVSFNSFPDFLIGRGACVSLVCSAASPGLDANGHPANGTQLSNVASLGGNCTPACTTWRAAGGNFGQRFSTPEGSAFIQDDFKLNSRLTLNMGLRWDYFGWVSEMNGRWSAVWPSLVGTSQFPGSTPATGTLAGFVVPNNFEGPFPVGVYQNHSPYLVNNPPLTNFGPRLGFAWQPLSTSKLVVRGGAGIFYDRVPANLLALAGIGAEPFVIPLASQASSTLAVPFVKPPTIPGPPDTPGWTPRFVTYPTVPNGPVLSSNILGSSESQYLTTPSVYQWNLNTQYEFLPSWVLEVAYVGSHGIHQPGQSTEGYGGGPPINSAILATPTQPICTAGGCATNSSTATIPLRVPLLGFSPVFAPTPTSGSYKFNSLQATVRKQFSHGFTMQAAYTWSRGFVDAFPGVNGPPGAQPWAVVYARNSFYRPQRFVVNYSWNIPGGQAKGILGAVVQGWTLSGVTTIQDGTPLAILDTRAGTAYNTAGSGVAGGGGPLTTANYCAGMGPGNIAASGSTLSKVLNGLAGGSGYFNAGVFCAPPLIPAAFGGDGKATGFGNAGPSVPVLGPGQFNFDMSLGKTTKVGGLREDATLQFRAEFFNLFNHPSFSNPVTTANSGTFGRITTASVSPRIIQFGLKYAF